MYRHSYGPVMVLLLVLIPSCVQAQIVLNQTDNFQDGTIQSWVNGNPPNYPVNIPNGGPAGAGDRFLQVSSGSFGGEPRSIVYNENQWIGNYISAGVVRIQMDLKNFGASTLSMRYALRLFVGPPTTPGYVSTTAFSLPADGIWHHAVFTLDAASLTPINSPDPLATFLTAVGDARILVASAPALIGDVVDSQWGVDNITASAVPEPATWVMIFAGFAVAFLYLIHVRHRHQLVLEQPALEPDEKYTS